ncbi:MAG: DUF3343 domain-containing protein [Chloroflexi bacterium]|mgnify:CR=1 FL=1|jgi:hypothetical protein|nr:DUF3343 domain-containing protein [Chloroflexota bacterium]
MPRYRVILVHTTAAAMRGEAVLNRAGLGVKLIPVPRNLSSDCGLAIRIAAQDREQALTVLARERVEIAGVHDME